MPKITEKDFGKKMKWKLWKDEEEWIIPIGFHPLDANPRNSIVAYGLKTNLSTWDQGEDWMPYEETFLMSPGIVKQGDTIFWSEHEFSKTIPLKIVITNAKITKNFLVDKNAGEIEGDLWILVKEYRK